MPEQIAEPILCFKADNHAFMSNFYLVPGGVTLHGTTAPSSEHHYAAAKTMDPVWRDAVLACDTPGRAMRLGKKAPERPDWAEIRIPTMARVIAAKFSVTEMAEQLIATGDALLVEGNWHGDTFFGVDARPGKSLGQGHNWLGTLLMAQRDLLTGRKDRPLRGVSELIKAAFAANPPKPPTKRPRIPKHGPSLPPRRPTRSPQEEAQP
jgi:ribA/ribD-fused uncharacterized protein